MAKMVKFKVLRRHEGDRMYEEGDIRQGTVADLGHLVPKVLMPLAAEYGAKAEPVLANKADTRRQTKKSS